MNVSPPTPLHGYNWRFIRMCLKCKQNKNWMYENKSHISASIPNQVNNDCDQTIIILQILIFIFLGVFEFDVIMQLNWFFFFFHSFVVPGITVLLNGMCWRFGWENEAGAASHASDSELLPVKFVRQFTDNSKNALKTKSRTLLFGVHEAKLFSAFCFSYFHSIPTKFWNVIFHTIDSIHTFVVMNSGMKCTRAFFCCFSFRWWCSWSAIEW